MFIELKAKKNSEDKLKTYDISPSVIKWIEVDNQSTTLRVDDDIFVTSSTREEIHQMIKNSLNLFYGYDDEDNIDDDFKYSDTLDPIKTTKGNEITVGKKKFRVDICNFSFEDEVTATLIVIKTNFLLKSNDLLITFIENIEGVEGLNFINDSDYETNVNVGELFDIEDIKKEIEIKIKENLSE